MARSRLPIVRRILDEQSGTIEVESKVGGGSGKKLQGNFGEIELKTPRDRNAEFEP